MPTIQTREGTYQHCFHAVTAALWDKYEGHDWIKEVEVLERKIDERGRLHSKRLLTMRGKVPFIFTPIFGQSRPIYLLENVMVDLENKRMEVRTSNVNFLSVLLSSSRSNYIPCPSDPNWTKYDISVRTVAFPNSSQRDESESRFGSIGRKLEEFIGRALLGNIKAGEEVLNKWILGMQNDCQHGVKRFWLCSKICKSS